MFRVVLLTMGLACGLAGQPRPLVIIAPGISVRNAAVRTAAIAPGSLVSITAQGIGFEINVPGLALSLTTADGTSYALPVIQSPSASDRENKVTVWTVLPEGVSGSVRLDAVLDNRGYPAYFDLAPVAPGLFSIDYRGSGPALALNHTNAANALTSAAVPNRQVSLFATGLGDARTRDVTVTIAGLIVPSTFAGHQGEWPGLDQINVDLPPDVYQGCYVPVSLNVRGVLSNVATLSINQDRFACAHPLGLSYSDLVTLDRGDSITVADFTAFGAYGERPPFETTALLFRRMNAAAVAQAAGPQVPDARHFSCAPLPADQILADPEPVDVGSAITLSGPSYAESLEKNPWYSATYNRSVPGFSGGSWMISAPGGADIPSFAQSFRLAPVLLNATARLEPAELVVNWSPSGYIPTDVVTLALENASATKKMNCNARATDGVIRIPRAALAELEPLRRDLALLIHPYNPARTVFKIERRSGEMIPAFADFTYTLILKDGIQ